jgi:hypothetical protein
MSEVEEKRFGEFVDELLLLLLLINVVVVVVVDVVVVDVLVEVEVEFDILFYFFPSLTLVFCLNIKKQFFPPL